MEHIQEERKFTYRWLMQLEHFLGGLAWYSLRWAHDPLGRLASIVQIFCVTLSAVARLATGEQFSYQIETCGRCDRYFPFCTADLTVALGSNS